MIGSSVIGRAWSSSPSGSRVFNQPMTRWPDDPIPLMCCYSSQPLLLRRGQRPSNVGKRRQVPVYVRLGVLHGNRPLLVPPVRLRHHATIHHAEPVVPPQVNVNWQPVAVVTNLLRIQHQRSVCSRAGDVTLQSDLSDRPLITLDQLVTKFLDVRVIIPSKHFAESCQPSRHRNRIRVVSTAVENFVL